MSETSLLDLFDDYWTLARGEQDIQRMLGNSGRAGSCVVMVDLDGSTRARAAGLDKKQRLVGWVRQTLSRTFDQTILAMASAGQRDKTWFLLDADATSAVQLSESARQALQAEVLEDDLRAMRATASVGVCDRAHRSALLLLVETRELVAEVKSQGGDGVRRGGGIWSDEHASLARGIWFLAETIGPLWYWVIERRVPSDPRELVAVLAGERDAPEEARGLFVDLVDYVRRASVGAPQPELDRRRVDLHPPVPGAWSGPVIEAATGTLGLSPAGALQEALRLAHLYEQRWNAEGSVDRP